MGDEIVVIDGWQLRRNPELFGDKQARILDIEAGRRVGLSRPRNIRKIIEPLTTPGNLSDFGICSVAEQNHAGGRGRPTREYWLTETQLIIVIGRCDTPVAFKIQCEVARVFVAWRNGRLHAANDNAFNEATQAWFQAEFERRWAQHIGTHYTTPTGSITAYQYRELQRARAKLATAMVDAEVAPNTRSALKTIDNSLESYTGWGGRAKPWMLLPLVLLPTVHFHLRDLTVQLDKAHPLHTRKSKRRQLPLKLVPIAGAAEDGRAGE